MTTAALYLRASTDLQKYSTANQAAALRSYANTHGFTVVRAYEDDGRSGLDLEGRAGLRRLLADVLAGDAPFNTLLVYDVSRWGRFQDADESAHYEFLCRRAGVRIIYVAEPFENDGSGLANIMKAIKRTMAAEYSRELSTKVREGQRRMAALGYAQGARSQLGLRRQLLDAAGAPKGIMQRGERKGIQTYRVTFVPGPPEEIALVERIFQLCIKDCLSCTAIAKILNREGIASGDDALWGDRSVRLILTDEKLIGNLVFGRTTSTLKGPRRNTPQETWIRVNGAFEGIISPALFARAQKRLQEFKDRRTDDFFLRPLRALLEKKGYLTAGLVDHQKNMPSSRAYKWRFRGLVNAYRLIGYDSPKAYLADRYRACVSAADKEAMLRSLKALLEREGYLSRPLISAEPGIPTFRQYEWAFGSLTAAYAEVGYAPLGRTGRPKRPPIEKDLLPTGTPLSASGSTKKG